MTSINAWHGWIALLFACSPLLLTYASILYGRHIYCRYLPALMDAMKNSRYVYMGGRSLQQRGWIGSIMVIATFTGMIVFPKSAIQMGNLSPVDVKNFPPHLRRLLVTHGVMNLVSFAWLVILYAFNDMER